MVLTPERNVDVLVGVETDATGLLGFLDELAEDRVSFSVPQAQVLVLLGF